MVGSDEFPFGFRPIQQGLLLLVFREGKTSQPISHSCWRGESNLSILLAFNLDFFGDLCFGYGDHGSHHPSVYASKKRSLWVFMGSGKYISGMPTISLQITVVFRKSILPRTPTWNSANIHPKSCFNWIMNQIFTPWKFNIAPDNIPSQRESSLPTIIFQGLC